MKRRRRSFIRVGDERISTEAAKKNLDSRQHDFASSELYRKLVPYKRLLGTKSLDSF